MITAEQPSHWTENRLYRTWVLVVFTLVATFGFVDRIIVQVLVQPIKAELRVSDAKMGLLGGLTFAVLYVLLSIPIARLAERRNRLAIISIGTALWSLATAASGFASNFTQLLLARIGVGVGEAAGGPATGSVIADYFPRQRRASAMAIYGLAVPLGALLGGSAGGFVAQHWGWRAAFLVLGLPGAVLALLQWLTIREPPRGQNDPGFAAEATPPFSAVLRRFRERPSLVQIISGAAVSTVAGYGINYFVAAHLSRRYGLNYAQAGLLIGLISSVPAAVSIIAGGFLTDWAGRRGAHWYALIPALGSALCGPLYIAGFRADTWMAATVLLSLTAMCQYAYIPAAAAMTQNMMGPRMRASAAAVTGLIYTLIGLGLGPLIVGALSDYFTRRAFAGDFPRDCGSDAGLMTVACGQAAATGLQTALSLCALLYIWSAVHLALGARTLGRDLARLQ
ncbi:MAG: Sugar phosphate permease [Gammaproteobacteria bacterium]|nr:Sugar phosphate permease [Gammaproteobacteria bacterium]